MSDGRGGPPGRGIAPTGALPVAGLGSADPSGAAAEEGPLPLRPAITALLSSVAASARLIARGKIRQPRANLGRRVAFADGTAAVVYRETVIDREAPRQPAVLVVTFRLRGVRRSWVHAMFRVESELNTLLFAGFPGLVSKLWLADDRRGRYRGVYQWDGAASAVAYVRALWWALAVVSELESIHYAVVPGVDRDAVLRDPALLGGVQAATGWWRPVAVAAPAG